MRNNIPICRMALQAMTFNLRNLRTLAGIVACLVFSCVALGQVEESDPLTPEEQKAKFHLPPGFEIELVVSETRNCQTDESGV